MLPSEFRGGEVAQKAKVTRAAPVDSDDRSEDASIMAELVKLAFDGSALGGRCAVNNGIELLGCAVVGGVDFRLPGVAYHRFWSV